MPSDHYRMVCDVPSGTPPTALDCTVIYEPITDLVLLPPLSLADAAIISTAIMVCWAVGWGIKQIAKHLQSS